MKVCVIQPYYSFHEADTDRCYQDMVSLLDACDESLDLIVLPEYSDIPASQASKEAFHRSIERHNADILHRAVETAKRCNALVFVNCAHKTESGYRNTTHAIDRQGNIVGRYYKEHPAPSEVKTEKQGGNELDVSYSYTARDPYVIEIEGLRFGFMTCYDFYFYEAYAPLALQNVDIIIGCSHQRTDTHEALSLINRFLSYHTNAYLIRSSVSLGEESGICGCSCVIAPNGNTLVDMKSKIGLGICEIDPKEKYYKPAGFRGQPKAHYEYIEEGRRPWLYRNGGKSVVPFDQYLPYPRLCAKGGFSTVAPGNSMPAWGSAIALGAEEIELDLWATKDGVLVACSDSNLERVSNGTGNIWEYTYAELLRFDFGAKYGDKFMGLKIPTFEEVLQKFASHVIMNIRVKIWDMHFADDKLDEITALLRKYDCEKHVYLTSTSDDALKKAREQYPFIRLCVEHDETNPCTVVDRAIALKAEKVQLCKPYFNQETIDKAHANGIRCNVVYADEVDEARRFLKMGIDCVLTNDYLTVYNGVQDLLRK